MRKIKGDEKGWKREIYQQWREVTENKKKRKKGRTRKRIEAARERLKGMRKGWEREKYQQWRSKREKEELKSI